MTTNMFSLRENLLRLRNVLWAYGAAFGGTRMDTSNILTWALQRLPPQEANAGTSFFALAKKIESVAAA